MVELFVERGRYLASDDHLSLESSMISFYQPTDSSVQCDQLQIAKCL